MQVKELAELTNTTVRTIRYYHQIGLLPVPGARDGYRSYDLRHVARLTRIRWLAQAGVPLAKVAAMLDADSAGERERGEREQGDRERGEGEREVVCADLRATVAAIDEQIDQLRRQRRRVERLLASVEQGGMLSPLPAVIGSFYDRLVEQAGDDAALCRSIRHERDFMELAWYRGDMPVEAAVIYERLAGDEALGESLEAFRRMADGVGPARADGGADPAAVTDESVLVAEVAAAVVERQRRALGDDFPRLVRALDLDVARRAADLYVRLGAPGERRFLRAIADHLLAALEAEAAT